MKKIKKYVGILLVLSLLILSVSFVSAEEIDSDMSLGDTSSFDLDSSIDDVDSADLDTDSNIDDAMAQSSNNNPALGATINIDAGDTSTIQDAIDNAADGDTIILNGEFKTTGRTIIVDKNLTIKGGSDGATINGDKKRNVDLFKVRDDLNVTFNNLKLINCLGEYNNFGSAISAGSNDIIKISDCHFENNTASYGGGCIFANSSSTLTIDNCQFVNSNNSFVSSSGFSGGGAICLNGSTCTISDSLFDNCNTTEVGGAIFAHNSSLTIKDSEIRNCAAKNGAAVFTDRDISVSNLVSEGNDCDADLDYNATHVLAPNTINQESKECVFSANTYGYTRFDDGYLGFCINEHKIVPVVHSWFSVRNNNTIINPENGEDVFEYLKLLVNYYYNHTDELTRGQTQLLFRQFTDGNYLESENEVIQEIIKQYNNGVRIPTHGTVKVNETTSRIFDFRVYDNMNSRFQNELTYLIKDIQPNVTVEKVAQEKTVFVGDQVQFVINVTNTGDCNLTEVFIKENIPNGLTYEDYNNGTGNWNLTGDCEWILDGDLAPKESVTLIVIVSTTRSGSFTNAVTVGSDESDEKNGEDTIDVFAPSMSVEKVADEKSVFSGDDVSFTVNVTNTGDCDLTEVVVKDSIPDGLTYKDYNNGTGNWNLTGDCEWTLDGALAKGESVTLIVIVSTSRSGSFTNAVTADSKETDEESSEDTVDVFTPSMSVEKVADEKVAYSGDDVSFTVNVTNTGDCDLTEVVVKDSIPDGLTYKDYNNGTGNWNLTGDCEWTLDGALAKGESVTLIVIVSTSRSGSFTNAVTADSKETDEESSEDTVEVFTPSLNVEKVSNENKVSVGDEATFTITVTNTGDCNLDNIFVEDIVPDGLTYTGYENGTGNWTNENTKFYLEGSLAPNDSVSLIVKFTTTKEGNFTNCVSAGSDLTENQTSNATVEVEKIENSTDTNDTTNTTDDTNDTDSDTDVDKESSNNSSENGTANIDKKSSTIVKDISKSTGNPLFALFVVLVLLLMTPFRRNKK